MENKWKDILMKSPFKTDEELIAELKQQISDIKHERDLAVSTLSMQLEEVTIKYNRLREQTQDSRDARDPGLA
jgi:hypothetical protein